MQAIEFNLSNFALIWLAMGGFWPVVVLVERLRGRAGIDVLDVLVGLTAALFGPVMLIAGFLIRYFDGIKGFLSRPVTGGGDG